MSVYLDTSALVKRYVREEGTEVVQALFSSGEVVFVSSRATWAECLAALVRRHRAGDLGADVLAARLDDAEDDLAGFALVDVDELLTSALRRIAETHALRGYDSIHLASALRVAGSLPGAWTFVCSDQDLCDAAHAEGFEVLDPTGVWAPSTSTGIAAIPA